MIQTILDIINKDEEQKEELLSDLESIDLTEDDLIKVFENNKGSLDIINNIRLYKAMNNFKNGFLEFILITDEDDKILTFFLGRVNGNRHSEDYLETSTMLVNDLLFIGYTIGFCSGIALIDTIKGTIRFSHQPLRSI